MEPHQNSFTKVGHDQFNSKEKKTKGFKIKILDLKNQNPPLG